MLYPFLQIHRDCAISGSFSITFWLRGESIKVSFASLVFSKFWIKIPKKMLLFSPHNDATGASLSISMAYEFQKTLCFLL